MIRQLADATLWVPSAFAAWQAAIGAPECHRRFMRDEVQPQPGQRILDIGCGVGASLEFVPSGVDYTGLDISQSYIDAARRTYGARGTFICADLRDAARQPIGTFDTAFAFGVLHHLPDEAMPALAELLSRSLRPGGAFVSIDPCRSTEQPIWSRFLMSVDRGRHIRTEEELRKVLRVCGAASTATSLDRLKIRYRMVVCRLAVPAPVSAGV